MTPHFCSVAIETRKSPKRRGCRSGGVDYSICLRFRFSLGDHKVASWHPSSHLWHGLYRAVKALPIQTIGFRILGFANSQVTTIVT